MYTTRISVRSYVGMSWTLPFIMVAVGIVTLLHYLTAAHLLPYHSIYRSLYYLPIAVAAVMWGLRGGLAVSLLITALYLPHVWLLGAAMPGGVLDNALEVLNFNFVAALTGWLSDAQRRHRLQAAALRTYIDDVFASLPVGVATVSDRGLPEPRNPAALALLKNYNQDQCLPAAPGYSELSLDGLPVGLRCSPLHGADGAPIGRVLVLEDLSEQRRLHERVRQAERQAALGRLAGGLAHEVRNPLAILRATAQLLASKLVGHPDLRRYTEVLTGEADRIDRLVGDLLAYASPRPPAPAPFDLAALITELTGALQPVAEQHRVTVDADGNTRSMNVYADREQIRQALLNLLLNALQASPAGGTVAINCCVRDEQVLVDVRDHGGGIAPEIRSRIFDPFFTTRNDGTGMGLAVVARIAADHGGAVEVDDARGGGALVTLRLPINTGAMDSGSSGTQMQHTGAMWPSGS